MIATTEEPLAALAFLGIRPPAEGEIEWTVTRGGAPTAAGVTALDAAKVYAEEVERDEAATLRTAARLRDQLRVAEARAEENVATASRDLLAALAFLGIKPPVDDAIEWTVRLAGEPVAAGVTALDAVKVYAEEAERDEGMTLRAAARLREQLHESEARAREATHELIARLQANALWFREHGNASHARLCEAANHAIVTLSTRLAKAA